VDQAQIFFILQVIDNQPIEKKIQKSGKKVAKKFGR
jgi:hypothetical protein